MSSKVIAGRYELLEKIGDGGMAVVYKAKCRLLKRFVAIKILKPEFTRDAKFIENFRKESHAAASLSHSNIVSIYDVGKEGNINYIVMELVEGKPLSDVIREEAPLDYKRVINITKQIAAGLCAAHKHGIIHRDVKPHNVLMTEDGVAKIADFGIAKAVSTTTIVDNTSETVMGSVHYFSPEQARGGYVDEKTDIYSLGIVMYEMLTGKVPFDGENPVTVALMHINEEIKPPSTYVSTIPPSLEKIVMKATDKYQTNRFKSAEEMIDALNNIEFVTRVVGNPTFTTPINAAEVQRAEAEKLRRLSEDYDDDEDDGDEGKKKKKKKNKNKKKSGDSKKRMIFIAVAVCVLLLAGIGVGFGTGLFSKANIEVPDVTGMTYKDAEKALKEKGLKIKEGDTVYSDEYKAGEVTSQDPKAETKVKKRATITVTLSKGSTDGSVPNLIGMTEKEAKEQIKKYDFKEGSVKEATSDKPAGTVIDQDPKAGTEAAVGSQINIIISDGKGKGEGTVPDLKGKSLADAKSAITDAGFEVGTVSYEASSTYSKDTVMGQDPAAGSKLEKGKTIGITVSSGAGSTPINLYLDFN
ncbi:MAG: Stk1 family PASTA domain-containing Ser/Thr kinase, partial [Anaerovoracaceae bacterium]